MSEAPARVELHAELAAMRPFGIPRGVLELATLGARGRHPMPWSLCRLGRGRRTLRPVGAAHGVAVISHAQSRALGDHLASLHGAAVHTRASPWITLGFGVIDALAAAIPGAQLAIAPIAARALRVSVTLPTPLGTMIVLSPAACETPENYAETVAHECQHAAQLAALGAWQSSVDYLGSGELRATREAQAYVVGLWARHLVTGVLPTTEDAMASLGSGLYHLDAGELELAWGVVASGVTTMGAEAVPPYQVAVDVLAWLREHAPEAIMPKAYRVAL